MPYREDVLSAYDVAVDHGSLQAVESPRKGMGYCVRLLGAIDDRWIEAYRIGRVESRTLSRFELDLTSGTVTFAKEPGTVPADVIEALDTLDSFLTRVNERAASAD